MTRLDRIIKAFNDYDEIVENLSWNNNDGTYERELKILRKEVSELIVELKLHGCRRKD